MVIVVECGCGYCGRVWLWLSVVVVIVVECGRGYCGRVWL